MKSFPHYRQYNQLDCSPTYQRMLYNYYCFIVLVFFLFFSGSCSHQNQADNLPEDAGDLEIPTHIQSLDNLIVLASEEGQRKTILFEKEMEFGSSDELMIGGLGSFSVDKTNKVYIGDTQQHTIHIFDQNGQHTASLGGQGRGPGEFQFVGYLKIVENLLYAFDPPQFQFNVFSTENFDLVETIPFNVKNKRDFDELREYDLGFMHPINKNRFLGSFSTLMVFADPSHPNYNLNDRTRLFYLIDNTGAIISDKIFEYPTFRALTATLNGEQRNTQFEFLGHTLISISSDPEIYIARTEDFLIKVFNSTGQYVRAFYYPFDKRVFTREAAIRQQERLYEGDDYVLEYRSSVIRYAPEEQIPPYWPALNDLLVDDEDRIWVSTIIENDEEYEWWVLNNDGTVLARFYWPVDEPIKVVKNDYLYTLETDQETGLQQVVRYRIELEEG